MYIDVQEIFIFYAYCLMKLKPQGITKLFEQVIELLYIQLIKMLALHLVYWGMT